MECNQRDILEEARAAFKEGNYAEALEQYEYFFDHALDDDPYSLYGVRLSYCLDEWVRLGNRYPLALQRLEQKAGAALALLDQTRNPERFHDFVVICKYLERPEEPIRRFLGYHSLDRELAQSVIRYIWDQLVEEKQWLLCSEYLPLPKNRYDAALAKFDEAMKVCRENPALGGNEFEEQIKGWYVRDVSHMLLVLKNTGRDEEASSMQASVFSDMQARGCAELTHRICERI